MLQPRPALFDTTVLSNFAPVRSFALAIQVWEGRACTTEEALAEFLTGAVGGARSADAWDSLPGPVLTEVESAIAAGLPSGLGDGERSCLAVSLRRGGLLVTDDADARRVAGQREPRMPTERHEASRHVRRVVALDIGLAEGLRLRADRLNRQVVLDESSVVDHQEACSPSGLFCRCWYVSGVFRLISSPPFLRVA